MFKVQERCSNRCLAPAEGYLKARCQTSDPLIHTAAIEAAAGDVAKLVRSACVDLPIPVRHDVPADAACEEFADSAAAALHADESTAPSSHRTADARFYHYQLPCVCRHLPGVMRVILEPLHSRYKIFRSLRHQHPCPQMLHQLSKYRCPCCGRSECRHRLSPRTVRRRALVVRHQHDRVALQQLYPCFINRYRSSGPEPDVSLVYSRNIHNRSTSLDSNHAEGS